MPSGTMFDPVSPAGKALSDFFWVVLAIGLGVVILVSVLTTYAAFKYRRRDNLKTEPRQISGNFRLEVLWTASPLVLLTILFIPTLLVMGATDPTPQDKDLQPDLEIIGHRWWWEFRYPKEGIVTANEMYLPVGKKLYTRFTGGDVIHDFWVPQLGRKMDTIPGHNNFLMLQSDRQGYFSGVCAEFCGAQHAWMLISVYVQPQQDYDTWIQKEKIPSPNAVPSDPILARGQQVFLNNTCVNCHAIAGTGANAQVAPSLSHFGGRKTLGAGIVENTPENLKKWIRNPWDIKESVNMPAYPQLSEDDLNALVAYLEALK